MLYEDRLYGFAVAAMPLVDWETAEWLGAEQNDASRAARAMAIAVAMEASFTATLRDRRDAAEQAAKKAREDAARAAAGSACDHPGCGEDVAVRRVDVFGIERGLCASHEAEVISYLAQFNKAAP